MSNISDEDDDGSEEEEEVKVEQNVVLTREVFLSCIDASSNDQQLLDIIDLLLYSAQCYGHFLTMNAIIKKISYIKCFESNIILFLLSNIIMERYTSNINI
jgi:hypothetical protein